MLSAMGVGFPVTGIWQLSDDLVALTGILVLVLYARRVLNQNMAKGILTLLIVADLFASGRTIIR